MAAGAGGPAGRQIAIPGVNAARGEKGLLRDHFADAYRTVRIRSDGCLRYLVAVAVELVALADDHGIALFLVHAFGQRPALLAADKSATCGLIVVSGGGLDAAFHAQQVRP